MDKNMFILGTRNTSANQYSPRNIGHIQDGDAEENSPSPKRVKLTEPQLKNRTLKLENNFVNTRLKSLGALNNESTMPNLPSTLVTKTPAEIVERFDTSHQQDNPQNNYLNISNQIHHHHTNNLPQNLLQCNDILRKYPQLQQMQEVLNKMRVGSNGTASQNMSQKPVILSNQLINNIQPSGNQLSAIDLNNLHNVTHDQKIQNKILPCTQASHGNPQTQTENSVFVSNPPFLIQNTGNGTKQPNHVLRPSLVHQTHTYEMTNASVAYSNSAECQNLSLSNNMNYIQHSVISAHGLAKDSSTILNTENPDQVEVIQDLTEEPPAVYEFMPNNMLLPDNHQESEEMPQNQEFTEQASEAVDSAMNKVNACMDQIAKYFKIVKSDFVEASKMAHELHLSMARSAKKVELIASVFDNLRGVIKEQVTAAGNTETISAVRNSTGEIPAEAKEVECKKKHDGNLKNSKDDYESSNSNSLDDNGDVKKYTQGVLSNFVLPPEYDPDDTRWTLKYREYDPKLGIEELIPHSKVYVDSIKLSHCKQVSKDCKTLARMLLVEVFTQSALSVCSLTGAVANAFNPYNIRPGLDEYARRTILTFVEKYARKNKWGQFDAQAVTNTMRSKIQEIRGKYKS